MRFLLDTNVVSELRRVEPHGSVLAWIAGVSPPDLCICAVTLAEIQAGVERARDNDPAKAREIELWLDRTERDFDVLAMDGAAFRAWPRLMHRQPGHLAQDAMIAAIATVRGLTIATRNVRDFARLGMTVVDPFAS